VPVLIHVTTLRGADDARHGHFRLGDIEYEVVGQAPMLFLHRRCLELWADEVRDGDR
jgi:hypothetical protein